MAKDSFPTGFIKKLDDIKFETMDIPEEKKSEIRDFVETTSDVPENAVQLPEVQSEKAQQNIQRIEKLFPSRNDVDIPLDELSPAPTDWNFFPLPDEETFKLIVKSIYHQGQLSPAIVWKQPGCGTYTILGGHTRFTAIKLLHELYPDEARFNTMRCHTYEGNQIDEAAAKFIIITNNMTQRAAEAPSLQIKSIVSAMELQKQIKKDCWREEVIGNSRDVVAKTLGIGINTAKRYYKLRKLIPGFISLLDIGSLSQATALKLADLPEDLQMYILKNEYLSINDSRLPKILAAKSVQEIEDIVHSDIRSSINGISLTYSIPKTFKKFSVAVDREDEAEVKAVILEAIRNHEFKNDMTKTVLEDILK